MFLTQFLRFAIAHAMRACAPIGTESLSSELRLHLDNFSTGKRKRSQDSLPDKALFGKIDSLTIFAKRISRDVIPCTMGLSKDIKSRCNWGLI